MPHHYKQRSHQEGFSFLLLIVGIVILMAIGCGSVYLWKNHNFQTPSGTAKTASPASSADSPQLQMYKIPELGVEFERKGGVEPVYYGQTSNPNLSSGFIARFSTQQAVDEGQREGRLGNTNCGLDQLGADKSADYFNLATVYVYHSVEDAVTDIGFGVTEDYITQAHGFVQANNLVFSIPQKPDVVNLCTNTSTGNQLEQQQFELLRESLMTLRAIE